MKPKINLKQIIEKQNTGVTKKLFDVPEEIKQIKATCLTCKHRQRHQCNSKVFQYCGVRKSKRTQNGLLKIKCKTHACLSYKKL